jgi:hypothetical protein
MEYQHTCGASVFGGAVSSFVASSFFLYALRNFPLYSFVRLFIYSVRFGGAEIHTVAAFLGGVAAQEGLKIILRQFIPVNNTMIYNGIHARQSALEL